MKRILIVDDEPTICLLLSSVLKRMGYEATLTDDGTQALQILAQNPRFDMILSDIRMPKMDGVQLLNALLVDHPHLPVILSSVHTDLEVVDQILKKGASFCQDPSGWSKSDKPST